MPTHTGPVVVLLLLAGAVSGALICLVVQRRVSGRGGHVDGLGDQLAAIDARLLTLERTPPALPIHASATDRADAPAAVPAPAPSHPIMIPKPPRLAPPPAVAPALNYTARVGYDGENRVAIFDGLPECQAVVGLDDDLEMAIHEALEAWLTKYFASGRVPPQPVELVHGEIVYRAVAVTPQTEAAVRARWQEITDALTHG